MRLSKETRRVYLAMVLCVAAGGLFRFSGRQILQTAGVLEGLSVPAFACYVGFLLVWVRHTRQRFVRREALDCISASAALMLLWLLMQAIKYEFTADAPNAARWLWYAYYVPITFVPVLMFFITLYIGRRWGERISRRWWCLLVVAGLLSALVLTNDAHQLVFGFEGPDPRQWTDTTNTYKPLFYLCWAWAGGLCVGSIVVAAVRSARAGMGLRVLAPTAVIALAVFALPRWGLVDKWVVDNAYKLPEIACVLAVAFLESLVATGLLPANSDYAAFWDVSSLRGGFVDGTGSLVEVSADMAAVTAGQVHAALTQPVLLDDGRQELAAAPVHGGTAFWVRDLSQVRELRNRLEGLGDALLEERSLLEAENDLARSREALAHREELYARVAKGTAPQLALLDRMLADPPEDEGAFLATMHRAAVLATYVKRCANLVLMGEHGTVDIRELALALEESAVSLRACGVDAHVRADAQGAALAGDVVRAYEAFQRLTEKWVEDGLPALEIGVEERPDAFRLVLAPEGSDVGSCGWDLARGGDGA